MLLSAYLIITPMRVSIEFFMLMRHLLFMRHFSKFTTIVYPIIALANHQATVYKLDQHYIYHNISGENYDSQML